MARSKIQNKKKLDGAVRTFVKKILGCQCPDEVFRTIRYIRPVDELHGHFISVGGRLLIRLIPIDMRVKSPMLDPDLILVLLDAGRTMRDENECNRFRLVLVCRGDMKKYHGLIEEAQNALKRSGIKDDKVHLHFVPYSQVPRPMWPMLSFELDL